MISTLTSCVISLNLYMVGRRNKPAQGEQYSRKGKEKQHPTTMRGYNEPSTSNERVGGPVESTTSVPTATSSGAHLQEQETTDDLRSVEGKLSQPNPSSELGIRRANVA